MPCRGRRRSVSPSTCCPRAISRTSMTRNQRTPRNEEQHMTESNYPTSIGHSDADSITLLGHDLAGELMGQVGFGELAFWLVALRRPSAGLVPLFEAALVRGAGHRLAPPACPAQV